MCDLFLFVLEIGIANYPDDNTFHATNKHLETMLKGLEQGSNTLLKWLGDNLIKANPEIYHLPVSTNEKIHLNVGGVEISNNMELSYEQKQHVRKSVAICATQLWRGLLLKKLKIFWSYVKHFWIHSGVRKYRILIGLCNEAILNWSTIFLDWHNKTKLVQLLFLLLRPLMKKVVPHKVLLF